MDLLLRRLINEGADDEAAAAVAAYAGDINAFNISGVTVLHSASYQGMAATLAALAARGDVNLDGRTARGGYTALAFACSVERRLKRLLAAFPQLDVNVPVDSYGHRALRCAIGTFDPVPCVQLLLDAGADVLPEDVTAACEAGADAPAVKALLERHVAWSTLRQAWVRACVGSSL